MLLILFRMESDQSNHSL
uniref:Uncharacterized protein n=1 Tax=Anguilla anguilla TaxID=7936 RepID=A0A0E9VV63_ANGAN